MLILTIAFSSILFMLPVLLNLIVAYVFKSKRINDMYKYRGWLLGLAIFNIVTLGLLIFSIFYFIRVFCTLSKLKSLYIALYLVAVIFTFTRGSSEVRFWLSANLPYMFGVSSCILLVSFLHSIKHFTILYKCLAVILCFFIVGNKITYIFFACFCLLLYYLIYKQKNNLIFVFCKMFFFSMFNVFACQVPA
jgi:hypothetical protein